LKLISNENQFGYANISGLERKKKVNYIIYILLYYSLCWSFSIKYGPLANTKQTSQSMFFFFLLLIIPVDINKPCAAEQHAHAETRRTSCENCIASCGGAGDRDDDSCTI